MSPDNQVMNMSFRPMETRDLPVVIAWLSTPDEVRAWARDDFEYSYPMDLGRVMHEFATAADRGLSMWTAVNDADMPVGMFSVKQLGDGTVGLLGQTLLNPIHRERYGHDFILQVLMRAVSVHDVDHLTIHVAEHKVSTLETLVDYGFTASGVIHQVEFADGTLRLIELTCPVAALRLPTRPEATHVSAHAVRA